MWVVQTIILRITMRLMDRLIQCQFHLGTHLETTYILISNAIRAVIFFFYKLTEDQSSNSSEIILKNL